MSPYLLALLIVLFPILFAVIWCGVCLILSAAGGWRRLADRFPAHRDPSGKRFNAQGGKVGGVRYRGCLTVYTSREGLHLSVWSPFRIGHPPLFIPWQEIHDVRFERLLWAEFAVFDVGSPSVAKLQLPKPVFDARDTVAPPLA